MIKAINKKTIKKINDKLFRVSKTNFLSGTNSRYVEQMMEAWKKDPNSVHVSWKSYFENVESGLSNPYVSPPTLDPFSSKNSGFTNTSTNSFGNSNVNDAIKISQLIRSYQKYGFLDADTDPIKIPNYMRQFPIFQNISNLNYETAGFTKEDLEKEYEIPYNSLKAGIQSNKTKMKLKDLITFLKKTYCGPIGIEFTHVSNRDEVNFIQDYMENKWVNHKLTKEEKLDLYKSLVLSNKFENFCDVKFTTKRFGLEGLESMIIGLESYSERISELGAKDITLGMAHRGRLNVLANVFEKPMKEIFKEFMGKTYDSEGYVYWRSGDVKYHLGYSSTKKMKNGRSMKMEILPNPSHLECVNPVVQGKVRAKQHFNNDFNREDFTGILIHGDAAFAGQGVNYETFQMNMLENYKTGGILHVIANNQIGFTTTPKDGRSTPYATDIGKAYDSPIIHVNADNVVAVDFAFKMAAEYSRKYPKDLIVDVIGYRKHGHNEQDQPLFTQPDMYNIINKKKNVVEIYENELIADGIQREHLENINKEIDEKLNQLFIRAKEEDKINLSLHGEEWKSFSTDVYVPDPITGINIESLKSLGEKINFIPNDFNANAVVKKIYQNRLESIKKGEGLDWATAEALCWGTLLSEGKTVRLSGQDTERGTFSHRHSVLHDQTNYKKFRPLDNSTSNPNNLQICLSHLSEYAVLGFETGFSYKDPNALVMWEAQFGDFANGAQVIIDQFIASGETKWNINSGLVLLLPHGMDGQGPEHSSCRIERYLECLEDHPFEFDYKSSHKNIITTNIQVCNPTTPANYFHLLMRQIRRSFRKPLIVPTPKRLLRLKEAVSKLEDFANNTCFQNVRGEQDPEIINNANNVKLVLLCSGNVYYDILKERTRLGIKNVAIVTLEQIAPLPYLELHEKTKMFKNAHFRWVQEEHLNMGCWTYVQPRLNSLFSQTNIKSNLTYAGRKPAAAPATGFKKIHDMELEELLKSAFKI